jgi:hypothetical protein
MVKALLLLLLLLMLENASNPEADSDREPKLPKLEIPGLVSASGKVEALGNAGEADIPGNVEETEGEMPGKVGVTAGETPGNIGVTPGDIPGNIVETEGEMPDCTGNAGLLVEGETDGNARVLDGVNICVFVGARGPVITGRLDVMLG